MKKQLPYEVYVTFTHNAITIRDKLIASFYAMEDAYEYARHVTQHYIDIGDKAIVAVVYNDSYTEDGAYEWNAEAEIEDIQAAMAGLA